jgi:hypothetical protein
LVLIELADFHRSVKVEAGHESRARLWADAEEGSKSSLSIMLTCVACLKQDLTNVDKTTLWKINSKQEHLSTVSRASPTDWN